MQRRRLTRATAPTSASFPEQMKALINLGSRRRLHTCIHDSCPLFPPMLSLLPAYKVIIIHVIEGLEVNRGVNLPPSLTAAHGTSAAAGTM